MNGMLVVPLKGSRLAGMDRFSLGQELGVSEELIVEFLSRTYELLGPKVFFTIVDSAVLGTTVLKKVSAVLYSLNDAEAKMIAERREKDFDAVDPKAGISLRQLRQQLITLSSIIGDQILASQHTYVGLNGRKVQFSASDVVDCAPKAAAMHGIRLKIAKVSFRVVPPKADEDLQVKWIDNESYLTSLGKKQEYEYVSNFSQTAFTLDMQLSKALGDALVDISAKAKSLAGIGWSMGGPLGTFMSSALISLGTSLVTCFRAIVTAKVFTSLAALSAGLLLMAIVFVKFIAPAIGLPSVTTPLPRWVPDDPAKPDGKGHWEYPPPAGGGGGELIENIIGGALKAILPVAVLGFIGLIAYEVIKGKVREA
jgi:hypothetical protein